MTVSRRTFVAAAAAAAFGTRRAWRAAAAEDESAALALKLGLVTYNWGRDWDLPTLIQNCEQTGFRGVELRSTHRHGVEITIDAAHREEVRQRFADSGVEIVGLGSACEYHSPDPAVLRQQIEDTKQFVRLSAAVGGTGVKVRPNGLPADVPVQQTVEQIGRSLNEVGRFAAEHGQQIRVEVHGRGTSEIPVMQSIMEIADHPAVGVCWNCNAADLEGQGLVQNYNLLRQRMATVHIHDLRSDSYPWRELFPLLKQTTAAGFTGWTLLEEGQVPDDVVAAMHVNRDLWQQLAAG